MHPSSFVGAVVCRDVQMLKQAIDEGMAAGAGQMLLAEAERVSLGLGQPVLDSFLGWSGSQAEKVGVLLQGSGMMIHEKAVGFSRASC